MIKYVVIGIIFFILMNWIARRRTVRTNEVNTPNIQNGVRNNFGARRNYM